MAGTASPKRPHTSVATTPLPPAPPMMPTPRPAQGGRRTSACRTSTISSIDSTVMAPDWAKKASQAALSPAREPGGEGRARAPAHVTPPSAVQMGCCGGARCLRRPSSSLGDTGDRPHLGRQPAPGRYAPARGVNPHAVRPDYVEPAAGRYLAQPLGEALPPLS